MIFDLTTELETNNIRRLVKQALAEDIGDGDITAKLLSATQTAIATIITKENMVFAGQAFVTEVFAYLDDNIKIKWHYQDGDIVSANTTICELFGNARKLLTGERTALNFLQFLSATATQTRHYVQQLQGTSTKLLDTRKTIPLFRQAQKYAVYCGGGHNHRIGLYDVILIKENHILASGGLQSAVARARDLYPQKIIDVEVEDLQQLALALQTSADIIMLDDFSLAEMRIAVQQTTGKKPLEASGMVTLEDIATVAATGVDYISVGTITKNIHAIDLSMRLKN